MYHTSGTNGTATAAGTTIRPSQDPNTIRVLVVGDTKVGKTLLIRYLCHHVFAFDVAGSGGGDGGGGGAPAAAGSPKSEEDYYFSRRWGPTIGFDVDCLVRDTYSVSSSAMRQATHGVRESVPRYVSLSGQSTEEVSLYRHSRPDGLSGRQHSSMAYRGDMNADGAPSGGTPLTGEYPGGNAFGGDSLDGTFASPPQSPNSASVRRNSSYLSGGENSLRRSFDNVRSAPVTQTVELYELGGTRTFATDCTLPLLAMDFDGIMFVYDRASAESTINLSYWYKRMKALFSSSGPDVKRPLLMLVGTQLQQGSLSRLLGNVAAAVGGGASSGGDDGDDGMPPDDALSDPQKLFEAQMVKRSSSRRAGRSISNGWCSTLWIRRMLLSIVTFIRLSSSPSLLLSEQYQEERSTRSFKYVFMFLEAFARTAMLVERMISYVMAVVLFGPYQDIVTVFQPTSRASLDCIKEDQLFVAQCYICRLDDPNAFETTIDEIVAFFDTLHREKIFPTLR